MNMSGNVQLNQVLDVFTVLAKTKNHLFTETCAPGKIIVVYFKYDGRKLHSPKGF